MAKPNGRKLLGGKGQAETDGCAAHAEFRAILEHSGTHAFLFEKSAVGGVQVFQVGEPFADFQEAMVARNFRVTEGNISAFAADDRAFLG